MMYENGDIVRFKDNSYSLGLHEITGVYDKEAYQYAVTNDECFTEFHAKHKDLILVCTKSQRSDL